MIKRETDQAQYDSMARDALELCVAEEYEKIADQYTSNVSEINYADVYDLLNTNRDELGSALKLGIEEAIKGNTKWAKNIFRSCKTEDNIETIEMVMAYFNMTSFKKRDNPRHPYIYSKILENNGAYDLNMEHLENIDPNTT